MNSNINIVNDIINEMRVGKGLPMIEEFHENQDLRSDFGFDSFDLAELTVRIEDAINIDVFSKGIISSMAQVYSMINGDK